eukprot:1450877-Pyramimonas_sp.AAC.1
MASLNVACFRKKNFDCRVSSLPGGKLCKHETLETLALEVWDGLMRHGRPALLGMLFTHCSASSTAPAPLKPQKMTGSGLPATCTPAAI